jgi:hypothetical protein
MQILQMLVWNLQAEAGRRHHHQKQAASWRATELVLGGNELKLRFNSYSCAA